MTYKYNFKEYLRQLWMLLLLEFVWAAVNAALLICVHLNAEWLHPDFVFIYFMVAALTAVFVAADIWGYFYNRRMWRK